MKCRNVGPLLEAFPRCSGEQPHSQAHPQLADKLCPVTVIAHASSGPGETAVPVTALKALDTPEGFHRCHYKLLVYTGYRNNYLTYLQWSLENKMKSLVFKTVSMTDPS
jgi:hypothetical protein